MFQPPVDDHLLQAFYFSWKLALILHSKPHPVSMNKDCLFMQVEDKSVQLEWNFIKFTARLMWTLWELHFPQQCQLHWLRGMTSGCFILWTKKVDLSPREAHTEEIKTPMLPAKFSTEQIVSCMCFTVYDLLLFAGDRSNTLPPTNIVWAAFVAKLWVDCCVYIAMDDN